MQTPSGTHIPLVVRGIATDNVGLLADMTITLPLARTAFSQRTDAVDFVSYAPGVTDAQVQPKVDRLLAQRFPQAQSQTATQFKKTEADQVNSLLVLIYVLLALSVIVSLFGIVNTLVLSIYERTRELGMLRAIGTTRSQVREMIRYESIITALVGGVLGIVLGIAVAAILAGTALSGLGLRLRCAGRHDGRAVRRGRGRRAYRGGLACPARCARRHPGGAGDRVTVKRAGKVAGWSALCMRWRSLPTQVE